MIIGPVGCGKVHKINIYFFILLIIAKYYTFTTTVHVNAFKWNIFLY